MLIRVMGKNGFVLGLIFMVLFGGFSSALAATPAIIVSRFVSNALTPLIKYLWSLKATTKTAISGRSMMKFESGYNVETVFDGSKLGIEPYSVEILPTGELLVLDSANSNLYKISQPLSRYSRPKLIAGSPEGYSGHVDGKPRDARLSHPKGFTVDDRGNIYIADTMNMVVRKISETGVTTIAGGNWGGVGGHIDGPSEDAKFSTDFDVVYIGSSCSLLVIDRVNHAIREIQLQYDDCASQNGTDFPLGVAVLFAAVFFGYMLALLQCRVASMLSSQKDPRIPSKANFPTGPYEKPLKPLVRPPLIPNEDDQEKQKEGFFGSMCRLVVITGTAIGEILGGLFSFRKKVVNHQQHYHYPQKHHHQNEWPLQESFVIPDEDEPPPSIEARTPTTRKTYEFMTKDAEKTYPFRQSQAYYSGWNGDFHSQQQQQQQQQQRHQQQQQQPQHKHHRHQQQHYPSGPRTFYEQSRETTKEIVFGAVQEKDGRQEAVVIKAVDYGNQMYNHHNIRSRISYMGYSSGY